MKIKKIRGHNRRQKTIHEWIADTLPLNFPELREWRREYAEILVHPWSGTSITESIIPEPSGKTKAMMLEGLIAICQNWKIELEKLNQPFYLKIWLNEQRFRKSQVVCAIEDKIDHYEKLFSIPDKKREINFSHYGALSEKLSKFSWKLALDEDVYSESEYKVGPERYAKFQDWLNDQRQFKKILKSKPKVTVIEEDGERDILYFLPRGYIWIGEMK